MRHIFYYSIILIVVFSCKDNKTKRETNIEGKATTIYKKGKVLNDDTNNFKLTLDYLMKSDIYQINSYSNNEKSKIIRIGTQDEQSRILKFKKNENNNELHFYGTVEWEFGGIIKNLQEINSKVMLKLYKLDDSNEYLCDLNIDIENSKLGILGIKLPKKYFEKEKKIQDYFISKVELDSILIKNPEYMSPLNDDPREYVPYYFKIKNEVKEVYFVSEINGLNMRNSSSTKTKIIRKLNYKEPLFVNDTISSLSIDDIEGYWVNVEDVIGNKGFVFSGYLKK